jgi:hypothetical protein
MSPSLWFNLTPPPPPRPVKIRKPYSSVTDPGCLSRIPDPDFYPSQFPDLGSRIQNSKKREGWKKFWSYFFCSHKFNKIEYFLIFEMLKKKCRPNFKELLKFLPKKFSLCSQIYGVGIQQCCGSMTFWGGSGSGSADPCLWLVDPDPDSDPDPAIYVTNLQDASKKLITQFFLFITFWSYIYTIFQR